MKSLFPFIREPLTTAGTSGHGARCPFCQAPVATSSLHCTCGARKTVRGATVSGPLHMAAYMSLILAYLALLPVAWFKMVPSLFIVALLGESTLPQGPAAALNAGLLFVVITTVWAVAGWALAKFIVKPMFWYPIQDPVWTTAVAAVPTDDMAGRLRRHLDKSKEKDQ